MSKKLKFSALVLIGIVLSINQVWGAIDANSTWTVTEWASIPDGSTFIIASNCDKAMYNGNGTGSAPSQVSISYNSTTKKITVNTSGKSLDDIAWIYSKPSTTVTIKSFADDSKNLYTFSNNNGLRVGTTACTYSMGAGGKLLLASTYARYVGTYSTTDWRSYTSETASNYGSSCSSQALVFYVLDEDDTPSEASITVTQSSSPISTIAFGTVTTASGNVTIHAEGECLQDLYGYKLDAAITGTDASNFKVAGEGSATFNSFSQDMVISYTGLSAARAYSATLTIGGYKDTDCKEYGPSTPEYFSVDLPLSVTYNPPCSKSVNIIKGAATNCSLL